MTTSTHYEILGRYLGFPSCCTRQFCTDYCQATKEAYPDLLNGSGYVPCLDCAALIQKVSFDTFVAHKITPNRIHHEPFPRDDDEDLVARAYLYHYDNVLPLQLSWLPAKFVSTSARYMSALKLISTPPASLDVPKFFALA